jgi:glycosyltransferase involved in cell wall biosynthesis
MPSLSEGLSMTLLEAMYLKKICLVSRIRPMLELVEDGKTGFLINHQDPEDIALRVLNILDSEEDFMGLRENAKNVVVERYNTAINIKSLESLYRRLINKDVAD